MRAVGKPTDTRTTNVEQTLLRKS